MFTSRLSSALARLVTPTLIAASLLTVPAASFAAAPLPATTADKVWGQPDLDTANNGVAADKLNTPFSGDFDSKGNLFVADGGNNRIVRYPVVNGSLSTTADMVWGASDLQTAGTIGTSATTFYNVEGVTFDANDNMYVADSYNFRVLRFPASNGAPAAAADMVWGQPNLTTRVNNGIAGRASNATFYSPHAVAFDSEGNMYVNDVGNHRVMRFPAVNGVPAAVADRVWGQPDFTTESDGVGPNTFSTPQGISIDAADNLYVADTNNHRVLRYPAALGGPSTTPDGVWGQVNFVSSTSGTSATKLAGPTGVTLDASGNLFVTESYNSRVVRFPIVDSDIATTADAVWGQDDFTSITYNVGSNRLLFPSGVMFDANDNMFVVDIFNNRVVRFPAPIVDPPLVKNFRDVLVPFNGTATLEVETMGTGPLSYQ